MDLVKYDTARHALAECARVDEVKNIRDKAVAIQAYAKQAKDTQLLKDATDIRIRAERRWGELYRPEVKAKPSGSNQYKEVDLSRSASNPLPTLKKMGVTFTQSSKWQKLAELSDDKFEAKIESAKSKVENSATTAPRHAKSEYTGEVEWYTPNKYLDLVREVLGTIELDPASSDKAQQIIKAEKYFTIETDGLMQKWRGKIWLNPPFMQPHIANFVAKMVEEVSGGRVTEAIMLTHNYTDTEWFHNGVSKCSAICFTRGRVKFYNSEGEIAAPTQGQAFFYFGKRVAAFKKAFWKIGFVVTP